MVSCTGLIFHGIGIPKRDLEPGEAPYWISAARYAEVLDRVAALPDPGAVCITFDDGNLSDLEIGLNGLLERGLRADFFVLSGRIGKAGSLDVADIRALQASGMGIGSHGVNHRAWSKLSPADLRSELEVSRAVLEDVCNAQVCTAAIPFGAYNAGVLRALRQAGYNCAYSSDGGKMNPTAFLRPRSSVREGIERSDILSGHMNLSRRIRRLAGMLSKRVL